MFLYTQPAIKKNSFFLRLPLYTCKNANFGIPESFSVQTILNVQVVIKTFKDTFFRRICRPHAHFFNHILALTNEISRRIKYMEIRRYWLGGFSASRKWYNTFLSIYLPANLISNLSSIHFISCHYCAFTSAPS